MRRKVIDERYAVIIEAVYAGARAVHVESEVTFEDGHKGWIRADLVIRDTKAHDMVLRQAA